jgi:hypothetical protein
MAKTLSVTAVQRAFCKQFHMEPRCKVSIYSQCKLFEEEGCLVKANSPGPCSLFGVNVDRVHACFRGKP